LYFTLFVTNNVVAKYVPGTFQIIAGNILYQRDYWLSIGKTSAELALHLGQFIAIRELDHLTLAERVMMFWASSGETIFVKVLLRGADVHCPPFVGFHPSFAAMNVTVSRWPLTSPRVAGKERLRVYKWAAYLAHNLVQNPFV
jgi:hypothetical protein